MAVPETKIDPKLPQAERWQTADGLSLVTHWWPVAEPQATIIIVHGTGDHGLRFDWLARRFNHHGFAVMATDWRGNGQSEGTRGYVDSIDQVVGDLEQMIVQASRKFRVPCFLFGQSLGGLLAIVLGLKNSVELAGVIASSPALRVAKQPAWWKLQFARSIAKLLPRLSLPTGIRVDQLTRDVTAQQAFSEDRLRHGRMCARTFFGMVQAGKQAIAGANQLKVPTLLMHGDADTITDLQASIEFAGLNERSVQLRIWPGGLHELHHDLDREQVARFVTEWVHGVLDQKNET